LKSSGLKAREFAGSPWLGPLKSLTRAALRRFEVIRGLKAREFAGSPWLARLTALSRAALRRFEVIRGLGPE
jgi:hypothetical protein